MLSVRPGTWAASMQAPRTIRSRITHFLPSPKHDQTSSVKAFILTTMRIPPAGCLGRFGQFFQHTPLQMKGARSAGATWTILTGQMAEDTIHVRVISSSAVKSSRWYSRRAVRTL